MKHHKSIIGDGGFTLLELLVVLTIASMLLAVGVPRLADTVVRARLRATAESVASTLRQARSVAIKTTRPTQFSVDREHQGYIAAGKLFSLPSNQNMVFEPFRGLAAQPVTALEFLPDGSSSGGTITISGESRYVQIDVDWLSGRVSVND